MSIARRAGGVWVVFLAACVGSEPSASVALPSSDSGAPLLPNIGADAGDRAPDASLLPTVDGGSRFCSGRTVDFCEDFDLPGAQPPWSMLATGAATAFAVNTLSFVSPPASGRVTLPAGGSASPVFLAKTIPAERARVLRIELDWSLEAVDSVPTDGTLDLIEVGSDGAAPTPVIRRATMGNGTPLWYTADFSILSQTPKTGWNHLVAEITFAPTGKVGLVLNEGNPMEFSAATVAPTQTVTLRLGARYVQGSTPRIMQSFDNVQMTVVR